jgi:hypothetical protein
MCHDIPGKIGPFSGDYDKKRNRAPCGGWRIQIPKFTPGFIFILKDVYPARLLYWDTFSLQKEEIWLK